MQLSPERFGQGRSRWQGGLRCCAAVQWSQDILRLECCRVLPQSRGVDQQQRSGPELEGLLGDAAGNEVTPAGRSMRTQDDEIGLVFFGVLGNAARDIAERDGMYMDFGLDLLFA